MSSLSFSHVLLARAKCHMAIPMATCHYPDAVNRTPNCLAIVRPNVSLNSSPAYGPYVSPNKYSDSHRSNGNAYTNGLTYTKYYTKT